MATLDEQITAAKALVESDPKAAVQALRKLVFEVPGTDVETVRVKEAAIGSLSEAYVKLGDAKSLADLLSQLREFFGAIPKAKTAKIVRGIIDQIAKIPDSTQLQVTVCKEQAEWARAEKRTFLRQRIELRLAALHLELGEYPTALSILGVLNSEVKKLDDKLLLVDIHLLESKVHHAVRNLPKARASLTAARTAANAIYVPVALQAEIDTQSGVLHAEERDYKTGYSYFFEAFEQFSALADPAALSALKYMLLCKIMLNESGDVPALIAAKAGLKYTGRPVDAMRAVAAAHQERSLQAFQEALESYKEELAGDAIVHAHLQALYGTLLEQNLVRLIEPFSRVEIAHVAGLIKLPVAEVEAKLSQMILDKKLSGTLDQGAGCLEVFDAAAGGGVFPAALDVMDSLGGVVDTLFARSQKVMG
ncbi:26S proteasome non-ATPase regulatory subunit [Raphidocelis subcapitata]|uniref:26S proteasome non-ATPase regulatory subunit n=1 Tax=Raphidocelis subcapitata TaxID=307507 RepID=A0A2V0PLF8_9CHLO|nr:26S proteasome non-ATPase regulatory subunit [Raphidocelis subcapitata]|eukprot:GBF99892.1 26S proteasome non-ATPase regulatory subunit [Raphidocelis subcapitata]